MPVSMAVSCHWTTGYLSMALSMLDYDIRRSTRTRRSLRKGLLRVYGQFARVEAIGLLDYLISVQLARSVSLGMS